MNNYIKDFCYLPQSSNKKFYSTALHNIEHIMAKPLKKKDIEVVDLFCGIGGLSYGLKSKGFKILAGYDLDGTCKYAYEHNNEAKFLHKDIKSVTKNDISSWYSKKAIKV